MLALLAIIAIIAVVLWGISRLGIPEPFVTILYCVLAIILIISVLRYFGAVTL